MDFCYLARRNAITSRDLDAMQDALDRYLLHREASVDTPGVKKDKISLPRQHTIMHYIRSIHLFGSPNGLCSSITESKHIKAMKEPWRRSSRYKALMQMLRTNVRMDKLAALRRMFTELGMMEGTTSAYMEMILLGGRPQPKAAATFTDEDNGSGPDPGPKSLSSIQLAHVAGK